ncbi:MAG: HAD family hydrolase [Solirubrobacteraceae bacterium]
MPQTPPSYAAPRAVLLDVLGTLLALDPPVARLRDLLEGEHGIVIPLDAAERGFAAEVAYYRAHHMEGRDTPSLADLRMRCARELRRAAGTGALEQIGEGDLCAVMLKALRFRAYAEVKPALASIRSLRLRIIAVSNWDVALPNALRAAGLASELDGIVTSAVVGVAKPDAAVFGAALALAGTSAEHAVHVGDSLREDVSGALGAGLRAVLIRRPHDPARSTSAPREPDGAARAPAAIPAGVAVLTSLTELPPLLESALESRPVGLP